MDITGRLNYFLNIRNWTMYRLGQETGISQSTLSNIFNKVNDPTISTLETICETGFHITLGEFFAEGEEAISLTKEQRDMLDNWGKLTEEQKALSLALLKTL